MSRGTQLLTGVQCMSFLVYLASSILQRNGLSQEQHPAPCFLHPCKGQLQPFGQVRMERKLSNAPVSCSSVVMLEKGLVY